METEALTRSLPRSEEGNVETRRDINYGKKRWSVLEQTLILILCLAFVFIVVLISFIIVILQDKDSNDNSKQLQQENNRNEKVYHLQTTLHSVLKEDEKELERLQDLLAQKLNDKKDAVISDFQRRFPREEYHSPAARRITHNLIRPLKLVSFDAPVTITEKVNEIMYGLDNDSDGAADPWEMHEWMVYVQNIVYRHTLNDQWESCGRNETLNQLSWSEYQSLMNPHGIQDNKARRRFKKDLRRWQNADINGDNSLTKHEFKFFLFPQLSMESGSVLVPEAHADLDEDLDGRVDLREFLEVHDDLTEEDLEREKTFYNNVLDKDGDGFLDLEELAEWVEPTGFVQAKSEVVYLMQILDKDKNKVLSREEVLANPKPFMSSQMTFFGRIYKLQNLRHEVFQLSYRDFS